jgi:hypothetical protein
MRRIHAVLLLGVGLALVGVALGLLYMDVRDHEALDMAIRAGVAGAPDDPSAKAAAIKEWQNPGRVLMALLAGSAGAGLCGAGVMLAVFELRVFRGDGP